MTPLPRHSDVESLPLRTRVVLVEAGQSRHDLEIKETRADVATLKTDLLVLKARLGVIAAIGAFAGGALVRIFLG